VTYLQFVEVSNLAQQKLIDEWFWTSCY